MHLAQRRFFTASTDTVAPFFIESIGYNPHQEMINREEGYPCFHWLHTSSGEGEFIVQDQRYILPPNHGMLVFPRIPHRYTATKVPWSTYYLTFEGPLASSIVAQLGIQHGFLYNWDRHAEFNEVLEHILIKALQHHDPTGLELSTELYRFLVQLKQFGMVNKKPSISTLVDRIQPLFEWLGASFSNPEIGTIDMAAVLDVSTRHLNSIFRQAIGTTPYQFLLQYRMQKAKNLIVSRRDLPIREIATLAGFKDASHFVATFRRMEGITPDQFRKLHGQ